MAAISKRSLPRNSKAWYQESEILLFRKILPTYLMENPESINIGLGE